MNNLELEILKSNHYEHFKSATEMALVLPLKDPRRVKVEKALNELAARLAGEK